MCTFLEMILYTTPRQPKVRSTQVQCILAWPGIMLKFCKTPAGPCPAPTYLPTYLPYLWETKKEITGGVKVGYYTN